VTLPAAWVRAARANPSSLLPQAPLSQSLVRLYD